MLSAEAVEGEKRNLHSFLSFLMIGQEATMLGRPVESWSGNLEYKGVEGSDAGWR